MAHLRRAVQLARQASADGDAPYGAVLVGADGLVLAEGRNATVSTGELISHAELNAIRAADPARVAGATMYASGEPCAMCSGAMHWARLGRVVFGASIPSIRTMFPTSPSIGTRCADLLRTGTHRVQVIGPVLEEECLAVFFP
ncbi:nucleoside deaminase [Rhizohabitans arisaemae]|uniref:nucleoside deaminase n=1 Tax=Rhizohabitans arisaemae TaxID=2720610 RepID=UPI0024B05421|nr:nucleoside deaminase [Rhizohabitans arisaemae]